MSKTPRLHNGQMGAALAIQIRPKAAENRIAAVRDDGTLEIRLIADPADTDVNIALVEFLSKELHIPKTDIEVVAGSGLGKLVSILHLSSAEVHRKILASIA